MYIFYTCTSLVFLIITLECEGVSKNSNDILKLTAKIMQICFNDKTSSIVLSTDPGPGDFYLLNQTFTSHQPIIMLSSNETEIFKQHTYLKTHHKLDKNFTRPVTYLHKRNMITVESKDALRSALRVFRDSVMWNNRGFFFIVNKSAKSGCETAGDFLQLMWEHNVLSSTLLCSDSGGRPKLYTYNPFTDYAPEYFWNKTERIVINNNPWTLFEHQIPTAFNLTETSSSWCDNLNFDKARNLTGFTVKIGVGAADNSKILVHKEKSGFDRFVETVGMTNRMVWAHLNATPDITTYPKLCLLDDLKKCEIFTSLIEGQIDYIMNLLYLRQFWLQHTFSFQSASLCATAPMTQTSITAKFQLTFTSSFWLTVVTTGVMVTTFLKYYLSIDASESFLEFLRMLLCMVGRPQPQRLTFLIFVLLTMLLNSNFQTKLSAMNVVLPNMMETTKSLQDLEKSDIETVGRFYVKDFFYYSKLYDRLQEVDDVNICFNRQSEGENVACVHSCSVRIPDNVTQVSKFSVKEVYKVTHSRRDWPLAAKVHAVHNRMAEGGFMELFSQREMHRKLIRSRYEKELDIIEFLSFESLQIAFYSFGFGTALAMLVFLLEILIFYVKSKVTGPNELLCKKTTEVYEFSN